MLARPDTISHPTNASGKPIVLFQLAWLNGFGPHTQPAGGPDAKLPPNSRHTKDSILKIPAVVGADGYTRGFREWTTRPLATMKDGKSWQWVRANVSLRTGKLEGTELAFGALDIDFEDLPTVRKIRERAFDCFGPSKRRTRSGSSREMMLYRLVGGAETMKSIRIKFTGRGGQEGGLDFLLRGSQCIILGMHRAGPYEWPEGFPEAAELPEIGPEAIARFYGDR